MYRQLISSRMEDACIFLRCHCGNEIITVYFYRATTTCEEIIALDYFGVIESKKLQQHKYYAFTQSSFNDFVNAIERCKKAGPYTHEIEDMHSKLVLRKIGDSMTEMKLYSKRNRLHKAVWDILIRNDEMNEFATALKHIQEKIEEVNRDVTGNN